MGKQYVKTAIAACLLMGAMIGGTVSFGFFMDPVTAELGFDRSAFSLYFSLVTGVGVITLPIWGNIVNKVGSRKMAIVGGTWTGITMAALSLCHTLPMFYLVGCLIGLGFFACSYAIVPVIVNTWFVEKNGTIMGLAATTGGVISMIASLVFPQIIGSAGWQMGYVVMGAMVFILTVPVGIFLLRSTPAEVGLKPYGAKDDAPAEVDPSNLPGVAYKQALKMPQLWAVLLAFLLLAITVAVTQHLAAYFVSVGFSPAMAGVFMMVISAGIIVTSPCIGIITDKLGLIKAFLLCSVLYMITLVTLPLSGLAMLVPGICVSLIFMSLNNANTSVYAPMFTGAIFGPKDYAAIWGLVSMANVLGQAIGAPLWGLVYDMTGGYELGMYISVVVVGVSFFMLLWAHKSTAGKAEQA